MVRLAIALFLLALGGCASLSSRPRKEPLVVLERRPSDFLALGPAYEFAVYASGQVEWAYAKTIDSPVVTRSAQLPREGVGRVRELVGKLERLTEADLRDEAGCTDTALFELRTGALSRTIADCADRCCPCRPPALEALRLQLHWLLLTAQWSPASGAPPVPPECPAPRTAP